MRKIEKRDVDFGKEAAEAFEEFDRMRIDLSKDSTGQECEKPDEARGAIGELGLREEFARGRRADARKSKMRSTLGKVSEGAALHVDEGAFAGRMHDLQDKFAGIRGHEVEVVVVFTGERTGGGVDAVEGEGQARGF